MPEDITGQLSLVGTSVMEELIDRLDADLSEKDLIAASHSDLKSRHTGGQRGSCKRSARPTGRSWP